MCKRRDLPLNLQNLRLGRVAHARDPALGRGAGGREVYSQSSLVSLAVGLVSSRFIKIHCIKNIKV